MSAHINARYTRSINIERDVNSEDLVKTYIPTSRASFVLSRVASTFTSDDTPRAWNIIGPYGAGKSSFAMFLSALLGSKKQKISQLAQRVLKQQQPEAFETFSQAFDSKNGFLTILVAGTPTSLRSAIFTALKEGVKRFCKAIPNALKPALESDDIPSTSELIAILKTLRNYADGILIAIDELGKFLEHEIQQGNSNDIFLLQELAEHAHSGGKSNCYILTLSHQALDSYASHLDKSRQEEWAKIQGRYETIPYLEPVEESIHLTGSAINFDSPSPSALGAIKHTVETLINIGALPQRLSYKSAVKLFSSCYPLHPVTALLLPTLCQRVAQNERTLFSFLASNEPFGLSYCIEDQLTKENFIYPWVLYDYFINNQQASLLDSLARKRWAAVSSALNRLGDSQFDIELVIKTVGIINLVGSRGGLKASQSILQIATPPHSRASEAIEELTRKSFIIFRRYNDEYRVWEGSDFNIDEAVEEAAAQIKTLSPTEYLNKKYPLRPIVANRHSIETGSFRLHHPYFFDFSEVNHPQSKTSTNRIVYAISTPSIEGHWLDLFGEDELIALCPADQGLIQATLEVMALEYIWDESSELRADPIAVREYKSRIHTAKDNLEKIIGLYTERPDLHKWYKGSQEITVRSRRELQQALSSIYDARYKNSPIIKNELINRDTPSTQAVTGRNRLIEALLLHADKEDLGIAKFPAEKSIYRAALKSSGLHRKEGDTWKLLPPAETSDPCKLAHAWEVIEEFIESTQEHHRNFSELDNILCAAPFGVQRGVLPLLYATAYVMHRDELALYEEGRYIPALPPERYEVFIKRPDLFNVQLVRIQGAQAALFSQYAKAFLGKENGTLDLMAITKPFARFMAGLPQYTRRTHSLSKTAQAVREAFNRAKSPHELFFDLIPAACGINGTDSSDEAFSKRLIETVQELQTCYESLLNKMRGHIASSLNIAHNASLPTVRATIKERLEGLEELTSDEYGMKQYLRTLLSSEGNDKAWLEKALSFLTKTPCRDWRDNDIAKADVELTKAAKGILDLEKLRLLSPSSHESSGESYLVKTVRRGGQERSTVVFIDKNTEKTIQDAEERILQILNSLGDQKLKIATIAKLNSTILPKSED